MKMFPDQEIINALKVKYKVPSIEIFGIEGPYEEGEDIEACYYYEDEKGNNIEWDKEGNLIYSELE